jgi:hypothetical protein
MRDDDVPTDEEGFTTYMAERIRRQLPDYRITIEGALRLKAQEAGEDAWNVNLHRAHDFTRRNRSGCAAWLESYVSKMHAHYKDFKLPVDRTMLRVVVRPKDYVERAQKDPDGKAREMAVEPLTDDLVAVCYIDMPTAVRSALARDFEKLGLTPAEAMAQAKENLMAGFEDFAASLEDTDEDVSIIEGDIYQSSWFALPEAWSDIAGRFDEDLLVAIPAYDTILVVLDTGDDAIISLHEAAAEVAGESEQPLSRDIYRWSEDGWILVPGPAGGIFLHV